MIYPWFSKHVRRRSDLGNFSTTSFLTLLINDRFCFKNIWEWFKGLPENTMSWKNTKENNIILVSFYHRYCFFLWANTSLWDSFLMSFTHSSGRCSASKIILLGWKLQVKEMNFGKVILRWIRQQDIL